MVALLENALFLTGLDQRVDRRGTVRVFLLGRRGLARQRHNRKQKRDDQRNREKHHEEKAQRPNKHEQPSAVCAREEHIRQQPVEEHHDEHHREGRLGDIAAYRRSRSLEQHGRNQERQARERELCNHRGGKRDPVAAEAEARLDALFPEIDILLEVARQKLAHFRVKPVDVGGKRERPEQQEEDQTGQPVHSAAALAAGSRAAR